MPIPEAACLMTEAAESSSPAELARLYGRAVFESAYRVLGDSPGAEDVQQEVFLRLVEKPPREVVSWPALLRATATRLAIDRLRRRRRWGRWYALFGAEAAPAASLGPDADLARMQRAAQLRDALSHLPARESQVFALRMLEGLELDAIAALTGLRPNTVSVALHRAARHLERRLADASTPPETRS